MTQILAKTENCGDLFAQFFKELGSDYCYYRPDDPAATRREVDGLLNLVGSKTGMWLDVCCGYGRHALELARRGWHVWGLDVSTDLVALAQEHAASAGLNAKFSVGDMRYATQFNAVRSSLDFNVASILGTSFGLCCDFEADAAVLENLAQAVRPGGQVVLELFNRTFEERSIGEGTHESRKNLNGQFERWRWIDRSTGCKRMKVIYTGVTGTAHLDSVLMVYTRDQIEEMAHRAGLEVAGFKGDFDLQEFDPESSRRMLALLVKA